MNGFLQDLRYGWRTLSKSRAFTAVAVLALALGIGANSAIFSVLDAVMLRPLPFANPDRIVSVWTTNSDKAWIDSSYPDFADLREQSNTLEYVVSYTRRSVLLLPADDEPELITGTIASADLLSVLGVSPMLGRSFTQEEDRPGAPRVIIIAHDLWKRRFGGDPAVIGKDVMLGDKQMHTVIGVMPPSFNFPVEADRTEFLLPLASRLPELTTRRSNTTLRMAARLKSGVTLEQAGTEAAAIARRLEKQYPESNAGRGVVVVSMSEDLVRGVRFTMFVLFGAVGLVLLIACANVGNLLLARALTRQKEIAIRAALGASHARIIRQLLTESVLLSLIGGGLGLLLALWGVEVLVAASPLNIPRVREIRLDGRVLAFTALISILTGLIFGLAPVIGASRPDLNQSLKEGGRSHSESGGRSRMRGLLTITEIALSLVLLIGSGLLIRSLINLRQTHSGFNERNSLLATLFLPRGATEEQDVAFFQDVLSHVNALPGLQSVGMIDALPFSGLNFWDSFLISGRAADAQRAAAGARTISPGYFRAMGIAIRRGRTFSDNDNSNSTRVAVVNEAFARAYFGDEEPIGKRISTGEVDHQGPEMEIIGVAGDVRHGGFDVEPQPEVYSPFLQTPTRQMTIVVRTSGGNPTTLAPAVRAAIREVKRDQYIPEITTIESLLSDSIARSRFNTLLLGVFAAVALTLAAIGLYGMMSFSVAQRTHEIGIRMALGAERADVLGLVVRKGMTLALIGIAAGLGAAALVTRVLSSLLYSVKPADPLTFILASAVLLGAALAACFAPAHRATKVDPIVALRYE